MEASIQKWGNSLALRIPSSYAKDIHLKKGSHVEIVIHDEKIVISPKKEKIRLKNLLSRINKSNIHNEELEGEAVGKEIW